MKYIMYEVTIDSIKKKLPIIFPDICVHSLVAKALHPMLLCEYDNVKLFSAGTISSISGECSGESETLKLKSNPNDTHTIKMYDYFHGM